MTWPVEDELADFSSGAYYDHFTGPGQLDQMARVGLAMESVGTIRRIAEFYEPLLRQLRARRVLDCGAGNGLSVDLLTSFEYDAWGLDLSELRKWQWREREQRGRLVVADALRMPFATGYFDAVISSGVIEHIGVREVRSPRYGAEPLPERDALRRTFLAELLRVCAPEGTIYIDCPNGLFPIDFWHGDAVGKARFHSRREGFLPTFESIRRLVRSVDPAVRVEVMSPFRRLQFGTARRRWYGFLVPVMSTFFQAMTFAPFRWLAASPLNPYLVVRVRRVGVIT